MKIAPAHFALALCALLLATGCSSQTSTQQKADSVMAAKYLDAKENNRTVKLGKDGNHDQKLTDTKAAKQREKDAVKAQNQAKAQGKKQTKDAPANDAVAAAEAAEAMGQPTPSNDLPNPNDNVMPPVEGAAPAGGAPAMPGIVTRPANPESNIEVEPDTQVAVLDTSFGRIVIKLDDARAPLHAENFRKNIRTGFYDKTTFHRVIPQFIIQGGDPNTKDEDRANDGEGNPGYTLPLEKKLKHKRGSVAMARLPDSVNPERRSNGSQFYICLVDAPFLDAKYTVFGSVVAGMDVAEQISNQKRDEKDNPLARIEMKASLMKFSDALR